MVGSAANADRLFWFWRRDITSKAAGVAPDGTVIYIENAKLPQIGRDEFIAMMRAEFAMHEMG